MATKIMFGLAVVAVSLVGIGQLQLINRLEGLEKQVAASAAARPNTRGPGAEPIELPQAPVPLDGQTKGDANAPVALIVYSDFQCPYCSTFARETMPTLVTKYVNSGKLLVAFKHLPLVMHKMALGAATAAECAGIQGQFWTMHDRIFVSRLDLSEAALRSHARAIGLNEETFASCLTVGAPPLIKQQMTEARRLRITGTPTFILGTMSARGVKAVQVISGAKPLRLFEAAIDTLLADQTGSAGRPSDGKD